MMECVKEMMCMMNRTNALIQHVAYCERTWTGNTENKNATIVQS